MTKVLAHARGARRQRVARDRKLGGLAWQP